MVVGSGIYDLRFTICDCIWTLGHLMIYRSDGALAIVKMVIRSAVAFYREAAKVAPCAIVSGSPRNDVAEAARLCGIADDTAFVLGAEDYAHGKPAPDGYLLAAMRTVPKGRRPSRRILKSPV